jgi:hypothetical protein
MKLAAHLRKHRKSGVFFFRLAVPTSLQPLYSNKLEINHSLHTRDPVLAKAWSYSLSARYLQEFSSYRLALMSSRDPKEEAERLRIAHSRLAELDRREEEAQKEHLGRLTEYKFTLPNGTTIETDPNAADPEAEHRRAMEMAVAMSKVSVPTQAPVAVEPPRAKGSLTTLSVAIIKHLAYMKSGSTNEQEEGERDTNLNQFRKWHEDHLIELYAAAQKKGIDWPVVQVNKSIFSHFRDYLFGLTYAPKTIEKKGRHTKKLFQWCTENLNDWPDEKANPVASQFTLTTAQKAHYKKLSGHQPFSVDEVKKLFEPVNFKGYNMARPPEMVQKPHNFFMPFLGLYTGARLNELAKTEVNDFELIDGVWAIHIRGTKNDTSDAWLPVHPDLQCWRGA